MHSSQLINLDTSENPGPLSGFLSWFNKWLAGQPYQEEQVESLLRVQYDETASVRRNNSADEIPGYVECPITHQIFRHPVMLVEAQTVVEEDIVKRLETSPGGPNIGARLSSKTYFPDRGTIKAVNAYLERHPERDNPNDRYKEYSPRLLDSHTNVSGMSTTPIKVDAACKELICSKTFILFLTLGGIAVSLYYLITSVPCRNLALNNLTGDTLSFTYPETADDDWINDCAIHPWQNVSSNSSIYLRRGDLLTCTFYTDSNIKLHTRAYKVSANGEDNRGCTINVEKTSHKCSWNLFKSCPNTPNAIKSDDDAKDSSPYLRKTK